MGVRERVASRMSRLAQRGVETPILDEMAVPAQVLSVNGFSVPTLDAFGPEALGDLVKSLQALPSIAYGKAAGATAGKWYAVKYPKTMSGAVPVCIGTGRAGSILTRGIPKVGDLGIIKILRTVRDDFNSNYYCDLVGAGARDRAKNLGPPWPLDMIWGWFCDSFVYAAFYVGWAVGGWILNVLWDSFVQTQIDRVADSINGVISDVNAKFTGQLAAIQDAVNLRLNDLYTMWGLPTNVVPTPLHVRNATDTGFEFQSYGNTTAYWLAIGARTAQIY